MERQDRAGLEVALLFVPWCVIVSLICAAGAPRRVYLAVASLVGLTLAAPLLCRLIRRWRGLARWRQLTGPIIAGCVIAFGWFHLYAFHDQITAARNTNRLVDIGENTYAAGKMFFTGGVNPYAFRGQIWHDLTNVPHVTVERGKTSMYGISYKYGYPYFPGMFISYEGFRQLVGTFNAIRLANLVFVALSILGMALLARRLAPRPDRAAAILMMAATLLCAKRAGYDLYNLGVTDILIPCYVLFSYLALQHGRDLVAGACLGMAQACKLLPGGLLFVITFFWYRDAGRRRRFLFAFVVVVALVVGPFFLWDWEAFFSATILYYLTLYADGDGTGYYATLPRPWRTPFQLAHLILIALVIFLGFRKRAPDVKRLLLVSTVCYLVFLAANKMLHLNYLWSIYAPSCAAFVLRLFPTPREQGEQLVLPGVR